MAARKTTPERGQKRKAGHTRKAGDERNAPVSGRRSGGDAPVWERAAPRNAAHTKLTPRKKAAAKAKAARAGRPYPNLVDNIRAARRKAPKRALRRKHGR